MPESIRPACQEPQRCFAASCLPLLGAVYCFTSAFVYRKLARLHEPHFFQRKLSGGSYSEWHLALGITPAPTPDLPSQKHLQGPQRPLHKN